MGLPPDLVRGKKYSGRPRLWHMEPPFWAKLWESGWTGKDRRIAILDTGVNRHPLLPTPVVDVSMVPGESPRDGDSHGTHCAGTALGRDGVGVCPEADLINVKVLSNDGSGSSDWIAKGIRLAADEGADVISMSLGGGGFYQPMKDAIQYALDAGAMVVVAAGNAGYNGRGNTIQYPALYDEAISTASYNADGNISGFSSGGQKMDWAAPGERIVSTSNDGEGFRQMSGTSMACPHAAGCALLFRQAQLQSGEAVEFGVDPLRDLIRETAEDAGPPGHDPQFGHGIVKADRMVELFIDGEIRFL